MTALKQIEARWRTDAALARQDAKQIFTPVLQEHFTTRAATLKECADELARFQQEWAAITAELLTWVRGAEANSLRALGASHEAATKHADNVLKALTRLIGGDQSPSISVTRLLDLLDEATVLLKQHHVPDQGQARTQNDRDIDEWLHKVTEAV